MHLCYDMKYIACSFAEQRRSFEKHSVDFYWLCFLDELFLFALKRLWFTVS